MENEWPSQNNMKDKRYTSPCLGSALCTPLRGNMQHGTGDAAGDRRNGKKTRTSKRANKSNKNKAEGRRLTFALF